MSMVGRSRTGSHLVMLVTVAATLLAAWMPLERVCACEPFPASAYELKVASDVAASSPCRCECCQSNPVTAGNKRSCCLGGHAELQANGNPSALPSAGKEHCGCGPATEPTDPNPSTPPRPAEQDETQVSADAVPAYGQIVPDAGPTLALAVTHQSGAPPTDLVISLSRLTC